KSFNKLKKSIPKGLTELMDVEGIGAKKAGKLYKKLKIKSVKDLEKAIKKNKLKNIEGFGKKSEENIIRGLEFLKQSKGRQSLAIVLPQAEKIESRLKRIRGVKKATIAGSLRRHKKTIGDIDIVVSAKPSLGKKIIEFFVSMPEVDEVFAKGTTKASVKLKSGLDADLRVVPEESYGAALHYFTGPKDHNIDLRQLALKKGCKLNEYGLFKGNKQIAGETEKSIYKALGLSYIKPENREVYRGAS
ncbi:TPA: DNA polymerase III, partial [Patescibacteria group bacterium]|nr:DNA polymerase III [Patescibacteria group bacterium]